VPPPSVSVGNATVVSPTSGTTSAVFTVKLSAPSPETTTVNYQTSDGSAWGYSDYTPTQGTLTFAPGQATQTVAVTVVGDPLYDAPETFSLNLSSPVNATLAQAVGTGTILSSVAPPTLTVGDISVTSPTSGSVFATFTVNLAGPTNETTTVHYATADGSAVAGSDYFSTSGTLTFIGAQTSQTVTVLVLGDSQPDPNETFTLNLSGPVNATIARFQATATIVSSVQLPSLTVGDITVTNGASATTSGVFTVNLSAASGSPVTVNYTTADSSATAGSDYTATSGTLTFAPGQTSQTLTVPVLGDPFYDFPETFSLQLSSPTAATLGRSQATGIIVSSLPAPSWGVNNVSVVNGTSGTTTATFTVSLSGPVSDPVTVNYTTADGSATAGSDYTATSGTLTLAPGQTSQTVAVSVLGDARYDAPETFSLQLLGISGAPIAQGTATIVSSVAAPSLSVSDLTVAPGMTGSTTAVFTVNLSAASGETTTVNYATANGTALAGTDYQAANGTLTFAPGQTSQTVSVTVFAQPTPTTGKTFTLNLSSPSNATLARGQATATIVSAPVFLTATTAATATDPLGSGTFSQLQVTSSVLAVLNQDATYSNTGTPFEERALLEYNVSSILPSAVASVTFNFNEQFWSTITQYVQVYGFAGTGTLSLADATSPGVFLGAYDPKTGTGSKSITLDRSAVMSLIGSSQYLGIRLVGVRNAETTLAGTSDPTSPPELVFNPGPVPTLPTLSAGNFIANQGYQYNDYRQGSFPLNLSQPATVPVTVTYNIVDGTAKTGDDYTVAPISGYVTIPMGQTQAFVNVNVLPDGTYEPTNESLYLKVTGVTNATLGNAQGTGTLVSTAPLPTASVLSTYASVTESPTGPRYAWFYVILSNASDQTITVNYSTADLTANAGTDYQATSGTLTFAPGQIAQTVAVTVNRDPLVEPVEQFAFNLTGAVNATVGSSGVGTITSGEHAPVAVAGSNQTVNEGATVQFDGTASSDDDGDPLTYTWGFGDGSGAVGARPTHVFADEGTYTVTLTVSDGYNVATGSLTVTVMNVAPTATITGPADAVPGQSRTWTFSASDPAAVDQAAPFTYQINWGDGSTQTVQGASSGVQVTHTFTAAGPVNVSATTTDEDNITSAAVSQAVTVVPAELQGPDLFVGGTVGNDTITIQPANTSGGVDVVINGQDQGTLTPTGQVVVYGQAGNDQIQVVPLNSNGTVIPLNWSVVMFAGSGNDTLDARGASAPTVLVGGGGNNTIYGGSGRNILIAGSGASALVAGSADDLLIAGLTSFNNNLAALMTLRNEWARTDADYSTRINQLNGSAPGGLNGSYLLTRQTVTSNGGGNTLTGGVGNDWFFAALGGANPDVINNLTAGEQVSPL
jgi:chitinase